jgi:rsbT antagonist protein RsbS
MRAGSGSAAAARDTAAALHQRPAEDARRTVPDAPAPVSILDQGSCLVVSIHAALDDSEMAQFRRELSNAVGRQWACGVLIDVAALDVLDSFGSRTIRDIAEVARLRGAPAVIVGIQPNLAVAMAHLGIDTGAIPTALDLEDGLDAVGASRSGDQAGPAGRATREEE